MLEGVRGWILRILRVPAEPSAPGGGRVVRVFRAAPAYFRYRLALWGLGQLSGLIGLLGSLAAVAVAAPRIDPRAALVLRAAEAVAWAVFLAQLGFSLAVLRLGYELRWYILSDRALRIREGIVSVKEKTITFANIQQISIRQGPLQRLLGIADVQVSSAGGGAAAQGPHGQAGESMHEAYFRGVDNAEEIRAVIAERVRLHRDTGLGDPDEPPHPVGAGEPEVLAAARALRDEVRALRRAMAP
jgi:membrane protein YdbS with pleckstrin-like domain